jgi:hypothetical protein
MCQVMVRRLTKVFEEYSLSTPFEEAVLETMPLGKSIGTKHTARSWVFQEAVLGTIPF